MIFIFISQHSMAFQVLLLSPHEMKLYYITTYTPKMEWEGKEGVSWDTGREWEWGTECKGIAVQCNAFVVPRCF